jgi:hypothetical protein
MTLGKHWQRPLAASALLLGALLSMACVTVTMGAEVMRSSDGKSLVSMLLRIEFDRNVYNAMQDYSPGSSSSQNTLPGWRTAQSDGGRIMDEILDPTPIDGLSNKSWTVAEQKAGAGRIVTARFKTDSAGSSSSAQSFQYVITMDERDPAAVRYSFDSSIQVTKEDSTNPYDPPSASDPIKYQQWQKLDSAIKAAGPGKMIFLITLPGTIEKTNGSAKGNQITWTVTFDKPGTYTMQASSVARPGGAGPLPASTASAASALPTIAPSGLPGDCDKDGKITESDALCALEMSVQTRPADQTMDMDQSGAVDSRDAVIILQRALSK